MIVCNSYTDMWFKLLLTVLYWLMWKQVDNYINKYNILEAYNNTPPLHHSPFM